MPVVAGQVIAERYRLVRPIGKGAQASVWIAEHLALGSQVAMKVMDPELVELGDAKERFKREATAAAQLRSAHVVQILDHGIDGNQPFMVMELLDGEDLFQRLERKNRLTIPETSLIVTQIARALARAHAAGIVHRDLKPENVYLVPNEDDEIAKVLDFGVAKFLEAGAAARRTSAGTLLGTPHYMSPEQVRGVGEIDHRSDLWSLGIIAYQLATGDLPFESEGVGDLLIKITMDKIPVPSKLRPDMPKAFDDWFAKACTRDVEKRFQSAREMAEALARVAGLVQPPADSLRGANMRVAKALSEPPAFDVDFDDVEVPAAAAVPRMGTAPTALPTVKGAPVGPGGKGPPLPPRRGTPPAAPKPPPPVAKPAAPAKESAPAEDLDEEWPDEPPEPTASTPPPAVAAATAARAGAVAKGAPARPALPSAAAARATLPDALPHEAAPTSHRGAAAERGTAPHAAAAAPAPQIPPPAAHASPAAAAARATLDAPAIGTPAPPMLRPPPPPGPGPAPPPAPRPEAARVDAPPSSRRAAPDGGGRAPVSDAPPRSKSQLSSTISGAAGDVLPPPELDGSRKRRALVYVALAGIVGAGALAFAVVQSQRGPDPRPGGAAATQERTAERPPPAVVEPPPTPSATASAAASSSAAALDPGQSKRPVKNVPTTTARPGTGGPRKPPGPAPTKDGEVVIEVPLPDREVPVPASP